MYTDIWRQRWLAQIKICRHTQHTHVSCIGTNTVLMRRSSRGIRRVHKFRNRRARAAHKPVIAIFADHLLVPSKTDCSTDIMWPECAFSSTPKTDLNSDETLVHISCANNRDLVLSASLIAKYILVSRVFLREIALSPRVFNERLFRPRNIVDL